MQFNVTSAYEMKPLVDFIKLRKEATTYGVSTVPNRYRVLEHEFAPEMVLAQDIRSLKLYRLRSAEKVVPLHRYVQYSTLAIGDSFIWQYNLYKVNNDDRVEHYLTGKDTQLKPTTYVLKADVTMIHESVPIDEVPYNYKFHFRNEVFTHLKSRDTCGQHYGVTDDNVVHVFGWNCPVITNPNDMIVNIT